MNEKEPFGQVTDNDEKDGMTDVPVWEQAGDNSFEKNMKEMFLAPGNMQPTRRSSKYAVDMLATMLVCGNTETKKHLEHIRGVTRILAGQVKEDFPGLGLTRERVDTIATASVLHDLGKMIIPSNVLTEHRGYYNRTVTEELRKHPVDGEQILEGVKWLLRKSYWEVCRDICRHHHEKYDGTGYPDGLQKDEIPLAAQIVTTADIFVTLTGDGVFLTFERACQLIQKERKKALSPRVVRSFHRARAALEELDDLYKGEDKEEKERRDEWFLATKGIVGRPVRGVPDRMPWQYDKK